MQTTLWCGVAESEFAGVWSEAVGCLLMSLAVIWLYSPDGVFTFNLVYKEIIVR
jgi:hypothetical protein